MEALPGEGAARRVKVGVEEDQAIRRLHHHRVEVGVAHALLVEVLVRDQAAEAGLFKSHLPLEGVDGLLDVHVGVQRVPRGEDWPPVRRSLWRARRRALWLRQLDRGLGLREQRRLLSGLLCWFLSRLLGQGLVGLRLIRFNFGRVKVFPVGGRGRDLAEYIELGLERGQAFQVAAPTLRLHARALLTLQVDLDGAAGALALCAGRRLDGRDFGVLGLRGLLFFRRGCG